MLRNRIGRPSQPARLIYKRIPSVSAQHPRARNDYSQDTNPAQHSTHLLTHRITNSTLRSVQSY